MSERDPTASGVSASSSAPGHVSRRQVLGGLAAAGLLAVGTTAPATAAAYGGYLDGEGTWGGVTVDATDEETVTVRVGAPGNGGYDAFDPAALAISPGTTVEWEWTGDGGGHDVVHDADERRFNSDEAHEGGTTAEEGFVYPVTFSAEDEGVYRYFCSPHLSSPMVGVLVVGEEHIEGETIPLTEHEPAAEDDSDGFGPGLGIGGAVAGIGGAGVAYALRRWRIQD